jgi:biotin synthase
LSFNDLLFRAQQVHRQHFDPNAVQMSRLLSIKTGGCAEDCGYCSQSAHYPTGLKASKLMEVERVLGEARKAKEGGATRYCMGAAWRNPKDRDMDALVAMVAGRAFAWARNLHDARHADTGARRNVSRMPGSITIITTSIRRSATIPRSSPPAHSKTGWTRSPMSAMPASRSAQGDPRHGRNGRGPHFHAGDACQSADAPESVPINMLIPIPGSRLANAAPVDPIDFVRAIALARILMPRSYVRLSAGRSDMSDETQALCFFAGANSIFVGETLLTADNPGEDHDAALFRRLGLVPMSLEPAE